MKPNFEAAKEYVFSRLERELPKNLYYHGVHHTRNDVLPTAERLGQMEGVTSEDMILLKTAALHHDIGYLEQYTKNEPVGTRMAKEILPEFGYNEKQIQRIGEIIMTTQLQNIEGKLMQVPKENDLLQKIMCDADLDSLGREDFFQVGHTLKREFEAYGVMKTDLRGWYKGQITFLEGHKYFTNAAKKLREEGKKKNLEEVYKLVYGETKLAA